MVSAPRSPGSPRSTGTSRTVESCGQEFFVDGLLGRGKNRVERRLRRSLRLRALRRKRAEGVRGGSNAAGAVRFNGRRQRGLRRGDAGADGIESGNLRGEQRRCLVGLRGGQGEKFGQARHLRGHGIGDRRRSGCGLGRQIRMSGKKRERYRNESGSA